MSKLTPDVPVLDWLASGGEMGKLIRSMNWSKTPLGPIDSWPQSLRTTVSLCLASNFPISIAWGAGHVQIYNDGYQPLCGLKHPGAMGADFRKCWESAWPAIAEAFERALAGQPSFLENQRMFLDRLGYLEETFFTFSFSPIRDETGGVGGLFHPVTETTGRMLSERRVRALRDLAARVSKAKTIEEACVSSAEALSSCELDVPFSLLYLVDATGERVRLVAATGLRRGSAASPEEVELSAPDGGSWPLGQVMRSGQLARVDALEERFGALACGPYPESPRSAFVLPLTASGLARTAGVLVAGVSSRRPIDDAYWSFYDLLASAVATGLSNVRAYEEERRRAEALAEIDRAKTAFFSNVSHEFRTPLTLMLGPLESLLSREGAPGVDDREQLAMVHRNGLRLLKLVNTLLDFSRIEAGRVQAIYEPADLASITSDLASVFRSAVETAGLALVVDCSPLDEPVYIDRDMWEKIVLNLISNAFKFTLQGTIEVRLRRAGSNVELTVRDTGVGIPPEELPRMFERFHRVRGAHGRTHEGTGIGLALVHELVKLHGGSVAVASELERGSTFTVSIPTGKAHLPADRIGAARTLAPTALGTAPFVEEALRWILVGAAPAALERVEGDETGPKPRVLLADDNADMREYIRRILATRYEVEAVPDGCAALAAVRASLPDLVLTDVMMPGLDGFGLLRALRDDQRTTTLPIILLSARAGEESRVEGLDMGADDYLIKPFNAVELLARVGTHLQMARTRRQAEAALAEANQRKDEFLAMLGHELRNPLSPILTAVHLMRLRGGEVFAKERAVIERQVEHLVRLIDDLLDVSRITRGKVELKKRPVEVSSVVARSIETVRPLLERGMHRLTISVPGTGLIIEADEHRLVQVFTNLLTNAVKYSERETRIDLTAQRDQDSVEIRVRDQGIGIEPELLPRVFELFTQGKKTIDRSQGGLGLGLPIVRSLVELHQGSVCAHSGGRGEGSEFVVRLPLASSAATCTRATTDRARDAHPDVRDTRTRVLVVDDNLDAADALADFLMEIGIEVQVAADGAAALDIVSKFRPHVVFVDIGLPIMDGYEVARRIRDMPGLDHVALVAVTGYGQDSDHLRSRSAGFLEHLVKPVHPERITALIAKLTEPAGGT
jgi:signal transduction histidine kinase